MRAFMQLHQLNMGHCNCAANATLKELQDTRGNCIMMQTKYPVRGATWNRLQVKIKELDERISEVS